MAMRSRTTFKKRQKEIARVEKQREKAARRMQAKSERASRSADPNSTLEDDAIATPEDGVETDPIAQNTTVD